MQGIRDGDEESWAMIDQKIEKGLQACGQLSDQLGREKEHID